jgi:hypothetical protein
MLRRSHLVIPDGWCRCALSRGVHESEDQNAAIKLHVSRAIACAGGHLLSLPAGQVRQANVCMLFSSEPDMLCCCSYDYTVCPFDNVTQIDVVTRWNGYKGVLG